MRSGSPPRTGPAAASAGRRRGGLRLSRLRGRSALQGQGRGPGVMRHSSTASTTLTCASAVRRPLLSCRRLDRSAMRTLTCEGAQGGRGRRSASTMQGAGRLQRFCVPLPICSSRCAPLPPPAPILSPPHLLLELCHARPDLRLQKERRWKLAGPSFHAPSPSAHRQLDLLLVLPLGVKAAQDAHAVRHGQAARDALQACGAQQEEDTERMRRALPSCGRPSENPRQGGQHALPRVWRSRPRRRRSDTQRAAE